MIFPCSGNGTRQQSPEMENETRIAWRCRMCGHIHYGQEPPESLSLLLFSENDV